MQKLYALLFFIGLSVCAHAQYVTNGTATQIDTDPLEYRLTQALQSQGGSVWNQTRLDLRYPFTIEASVNLGSSDWGADGIAFVLQPLSSDQGGVGGGLGYQGISTSLAIEFDTWQNGEHGDPANDHIAFMKNGSVTHTTGVQLAGPYEVANLEDGQWRSARFEWNPVAKTLSLTFMNQVYPLSYDLVHDIFGDNPYVYWGFTGATGAAVNDQRVRIGAIDLTEEIVIQGTPTAATCAGANGGVDITVSGGSGEYTFAWSNGSASEDLSGVTAGEYTVTVTDGNGVEKSETFTVGGVSGTAPTATINDVKALNYPGVATNTVYLGYAGASSVTIRAEASGGISPYSYSWSNGATGQEITVSPSVATTYTVTVTGANGCSDEAAIVIQVLSAICGNTGGKVVMCHVAGNDATHVKTICIDGTSVMDHLLQGCSLGACESTTAVERVITGESTGVFGVMALPNPSRSAFQIKIEGSAGEALELRVMDAMGRLVERRANLQGVQSLQIGGNYKAGVYTIDLLQGNNRKQLKLVKLGN